MDITRKLLREQIEEAKKECLVSMKKLRDLQIQELKFSDSERQYSEGLETKKYLKHKNKMPNEELFVGRIKFFENFKDEDTGELVPIERNPPVMIDHKWDKDYFYNPKV